LGGFSVAVWTEATRLGIPIAHTLHDYYLLCPPVTMFRGGAACERQCASCKPYAWPRRLLSRHVRGAIGVSRFILDLHDRYGYFREASLRSVIRNPAQGSAPSGFKARVNDGSRNGPALRGRYLGGLHP